MKTILWKFAYSPFYVSLLGYFKNHQFDFIGPILGQEISQKKLNQIVNFRIENYRIQSPHLIPTTEDEKIIQHIIDQKSYHVLCEDKGEIIGAIRLTPYPFDRVPTDIRFGEHLELSRLIVKKSGKKIGKHLLIYTGLQTIINSDKKGFVAICKRPNYKIFKKFGLKKVSTISFNDREEDYFFIEATFQQITHTTLKYVIKKSNDNIRNKIKLISNKLSKLSGVGNEI